MTTFTLDGRTVSVPPGRTLLDACRANGVHVPTLCHMEGVSEAASCRLCLVEVRGLQHPVPACATGAQDGMVVETATPALRQARRFVVELLFSGGQHVCAFCPASGDCELQDLAAEVGLDHLERSLPGPAPAVDASRARFALDQGRCVLCTRCVRACSELEGAHTLGVAGRGAAARLFTDGGGAWGGSTTCTDCGRCVEACPTGALFDKNPATFPATFPVTDRRPGPDAPAAAARGAGGPPEPVPRSPARRLRLATAWLGGCSGCHMSFLDMDEGLLELAPRLEVVYSPLVDAKEYPTDVDVCLVEGAVSGGDHASLLLRIRERTHTLVALGDCAASGNVTGMRDARGGAEAVLRRAWPGPDGGPARREAGLPVLLDRVQPLHEIVAVDHFLPGCPPSADAIRRTLVALLDGRAPDLAGRVHLG